LPLKFPITIGVFEHKILGLVRSYDRSRTEKFSFLGTPVSMGNFNGNAPAFKLPKKAKDRTVVTLWSPYLLVLHNMVTLYYIGKVVLEGPVSRLEKYRDQTGPQPIKTGKMMDRSRLQLRSGLWSIAISDLRRPTKNQFKQVSTSRSVPKFNHG
jgi:hypothetical protein